MVAKISTASKISITITAMPYINFTPDVNTKAKGRLIAQISITYPKSLNTEQKELVQKLDDSFGVHSKPYENIFQEAFEKIRGWFNEKKHDKKKR